MNRLRPAPETIDKEYDKELQKFQQRLIEMQSAHNQYKEAHLSR